MGILSNIFHKIFPASHPALDNSAKSTTPPSQYKTAVNPTAAKPVPQASTATASTATAAQTPQATSTSTPTQASSTAPQFEEVDVEKVLNAKASTVNQSLNWRSSIVDLLKLLELDSSLQARKELATELGYHGDPNDSAAMNIWLHRQVMNMLAANGGKVPEELRD